MKSVNRLSPAYMDMCDAFSAQKMEPKIKEENGVRAGIIKNKTKWKKKKNPTPKYTQPKAILRRSLDNNS